MNTIFTNLAEIDILSFDETQSEEKPEYIDLNYDALAYCIAMQQESVQNYNIVERITRGKVDSGLIQPKHIAQATKIKNYFVNKHTMRRLKNQHISKFMLAIDDIVDNPNKILKSSLPVLVSIPRVYSQNTELESIMSQSKSCNKRGELELNHAVEFVGKVNIKNTGKNITKFFWKTLDQQLIMIDAKTVSEESSWNFVAKQENLKFLCERAVYQRLTGYEFVAIMPVTEINIVSEV